MLHEAYSRQGSMTGALASESNAAFFFQSLQHYAL
jgi:hypothetical protein